MKKKTKNFLKILIIIVSLLILICLGTFATFKYLENKKIDENINNIYNIYNNDNRQEIINQYPSVNNENVPGVPITCEENETELLNALATLEIPSINFKDIVIEGTTQNSLAQGIGLFEHSNILDGNVCLAGHNTHRFLYKLKDVNKGDIIKYSSCLGNKEYKIVAIKQIDQTDWTMLENTEDNRITIITCIKGQPNLRLCVQAYEI